ncbi:hypothetical protein DMA12_23295 [Amycolatopsis balhimycina DSM 5908]|uniref:Secreted protein n=1 Tax=Amycolatopsis balhimycina DSM 5908 TaxID=1081091 RepID=A0A428WFL3_AMYBA|nr:hypothetical protein [Amycolatopsis balhimycina]RSM41875.1 hypothetical protein DMA12_23295 [Amycolatopsis balhimycina DSM 5908]
MRCIPWIALAAAVTAGCAGPGAGPEVACPAIGYVTGISLKIPTPAGISRATLDACWRGQCVTREVVLTPDTTAVASPCTGGPDSACAASMVPTGGLRGFAEVPGLPAEPVRVTVRFDDGRPHTADITPAYSEPHGSACGKVGPQAQLLVGPDRELRAG